MVVRKAYDHWEVEISTWNKSNIVTSIDRDCRQLAKRRPEKYNQLKCNNRNKEYKLYRSNYISISEETNEIAQNDWKSKKDFRLCTFNNLKKVEVLMNFEYLDFGIEDAAPVIAIFITLIPTVLFRQSALGFIFFSDAVGIAFLAGSMK